MTGVLSGLVPALRVSRTDLTPVMHDGGRGGTAGRTRRSFGRGLIVAQLAFSVVLVLGAGLLARSLVALTRIEPGFDPRGVLTADLQLPATTYPRPEHVVAFYRTLDARIRQLPGVVSAGAVGSSR